MTDTEILTATETAHGAYRARQERDPTAADPREDHDHAATLVLRHRRSNLPLEGDYHAQRRKSCTSASPRNPITSSRPCTHWSGPRTSTGSADHARRPGYVPGPAQEPRHRRHPLHGGVHRAGHRPQPRWSAPPDSDDHNETVQGRRAQPDPSRHRADVVPGCRRDVALVIDRVMIMGTFVAVQPRMGAMPFPRLTCPRCGWRIAVLAMHANGRLTVHELPRRPPEEDVCA